jgi:hypothetical protein
VPITVALMLAALSLTSGCSWALLQSMPEDYENREYVDCTTNTTAPVVDTIFTLLNAGSTVYLERQDDVPNKGAALGVGVLAAAVWGASAVYGYVETAECAAYRRDRQLHEGHWSPSRPQFYPQPPPVLPPTENPSIAAPPSPTPPASAPPPPPAD